MTNTPMGKALDALIEIQRVLDDANAQPGGPIADTIWRNEHETLFDYIASEIESLRSALAQPDGWKKECEDTDKLLVHLGLDPDLCRTDGGWLNLQRIKETLNLPRIKQALEQQQPVEATNDLAEYLSWAFCITKSHAHDLMRLALAQQGGQHPVVQPVHYSGAGETPPVFGRRWKLAADGFGLQRDDADGQYVHIDDALSVLHQWQAAPAAQPAQASKLPEFCSCKESHPMECEGCRANREAAQPVQGESNCYDMPHGWVVNWPHPNGGTKPVYHPSAVKPKFGEELDGKLTMYPVYTHATPTPPTPQPDARKVIEQMDSDPDTKLYGAGMLLNRYNSAIGVIGQMVTSLSKFVDKLSSDQLDEIGMWSEYESASLAREAGQQWLKEYK